MTQLTRRSALRLAGAGAVGASIGFGRSAAAKEFPQIAIGTLAAGSIYHITGTALTKELGAKLKQPVNVQPFGGTTTSLAVVDQGEIALAIGAAMEISDAYNGVAPYKKMPNLRMIGVLYPLYASIVVRNESPIKTVKDLKGKRVAGNFPAMLVGRQLTESLLAAEGLGWKDVTIVPVPNIQAGMPLLVEKRMDASFCSIGTAMLREIDAQVSGGVRFLSLNAAPDAVARMQQAAPGTYVAPLKKGFTTGILEDMNVQAFDTQLVGATHMSDELAYNTVKALAESEKELSGAFPPMREFAKAKLAKANVPIPFHPGAVKAYKEMGLWSPEIEAAQAKLAK